MATTELKRSYAHSGLVRRVPTAGTGPGDLHPTIASAQGLDGEPCALHEFAHRPGLAVLVLGVNAVDSDDIPLPATNCRRSLDAAPINAVIGLCNRSEDLPISRIDQSVADQVGTSGATVLAVAPIGSSVSATTAPIP
jgi:hypothetical protein